MNYTAQITPIERHYLPENFAVTDWESLEPYLKELEERTSRILSGYRQVMEQSLRILLTEEVLSGEAFRRLLRSQAPEKARI